MLTPISGLTSKPTSSFRCVHLQMGIHRQITKIRHFAVGRERETSPLIEWVNRIIKNAIEPKYLEMDMFSVMTHVMAKEVSINTTFDSTFMPQTVNTDRFIEGKTMELYIPTYGLLQTVLDLEMGWEDWKELKTIKLLYVDSGELPLKWFDQIKFETDLPSLAIFGISTVALIMQYVAYAKANDVDIAIDNMSDFVYSCVIPNLRTDLVENWMLATLSSKLQGFPIQYPDSEFITTTDIVKYEYELDLFVTNFMKRGTVLDKLINHQWVRGSSILQLARHRQDYYQFATKSRYEGITPIVFKHFDDILIWMMTHGSGPSKSTTLFSQFKKVFKNHRGKKPEHNIKIPYAKLFYSSHIAEINDLL